MFDRLQAQIARTERRLAMLEKEQIFREPSHAISVKTSDQERNDQLHRSTIMQFTRHGPRYDTPLQRHINFEPFSARRAGYRVFQHRGRRCHTLIFFVFVFLLMGEDAHVRKARSGCGSTLTEILSHHLFH